MWPSRSPPLSKRLTLDNDIRLSPIRLAYPLKMDGRSRVDGERGLEMYDVRNHITGRTLTFTSDPYRAADVACGFEPLLVRADLGGTHYYRVAGRPDSGSPTPSMSTLMQHSRPT